MCAYSIQAGGPDGEYADMERALGLLLGALEDGPALGLLKLGLCCGEGALAPVLLHVHAPKLAP